MILTDAGPLVAIIDRGEADHSACVKALAALSPPMLTTWPALTEAMCLLGEAGGWRAQAALWNLLERGDLELANLGDLQLRRMRLLMEKYRDLPMDMADASLVAVAEERGLKEVFTLDAADFHVYRLHGRAAFSIIPQRHAR